MPTRQGATSTKIARNTRGTAGHTGKKEVPFTPTKGSKCPEHCGHDSVGAVTTNDNGDPNAHKVKGKASDPEYIAELSDASGYAGTVYICRVIYGELRVENVYLYHLVLENSVPTYNGTTENHVIPKECSP